MAAVRAGYRHIDCASIYQNEHEVGQALAEVLSEGVVSRQQLFITSKLWNTDHAPDRVAAACRKTLADLRLSYLDLYLIHWPVTPTPGPELVPDIGTTWVAMEALVREGLVRSIGVSNFSATKLQRLLLCPARVVAPAVNQVEVHPYFRNDALIAWCRGHGIHVTAYSPLGSPDSGAIFKRKFSPSLMQDPVVVDVASKMEKSPAQVLVRWALQHGTSVLPKSSNPQRIKANLQVSESRVMSGTGG